MASISAECPICFERFSGPIFLCETGHPICGQCTSQVTQCPSCRAPMTKDQNFTLKAKNLKSQIREFPEERASAPPELNLAEIEIKDSYFKLDEDNVKILTSLKEINAVKRLTCINISCKKIPEILKKFKEIQTLIFGHRMIEFGTPGKCNYFNSIPGDGSEDCIFKLPQNNKFENLNYLEIWDLEINTGDINIGHKNLPNLKQLGIYGCNIRGDLVDTILTRQFSLEWINLMGNVPLLEKKDVEELLRSETLKIIHLSTYRGLQVISGSFAPIGPDGKLFDKITQNAYISFKRDSNSEHWNSFILRNKHQ